MPTYWPKQSSTTPALPRDPGPSVLDSWGDRAMRGLRSLVGADDIEGSVMSGVMPGAIGVTTFGNTLARQLRTSHMLDKIQEVTERLGWAPEARQQAGQILGQKAPRTLAHIEDIGLRRMPGTRGANMDARAAGYASVPGRSVVYLDPAEHPTMGTLLEEVAGHGPQRIGLKDALPALNIAANRVGGYAANPIEASAKSTAGRLLPGGPTAAHPRSDMAGRAIDGLNRLIGENAVPRARAITQGAAPTFDNVGTAANYLVESGMPSRVAGFNNTATQAIDAARDVEALIASLFTRR